MTNESERAKFEVWYTSIFDDLPLREDGQYKDPTSRVMLEAWLARAESSGKEVMDWKTIDSAPRDGTSILVYSSIGNPVTMEGVVIAEFWEHQQIDDGNEWWSVSHDGLGTTCFNPTHWMQLPEPPK